MFENLRDRFNQWVKKQLDPGPTRLGADFLGDKTNRESRARAHVAFDATRALTRLHPFDIAEIHLAGKTARGEAHPSSDVDLLIKVRSGQGQKIAQEADSLRRVLQRMTRTPYEARLVQRLDFIIRDPKLANNDPIATAFYENVQKEGIRLYSADKRRWLRTRQTPIK